MYIIAERKMMYPEIKLNKDNLTVGKSMPTLEEGHGYVRIMGWHQLNRLLTPQLCHFLDSHRCPSEFGFIHSFSIYLSSTRGVRHCPRHQGTQSKMT